VLLVAHFRDVGQVAEVEGSFPVLDAVFDDGLVVDGGQKLCIRTNKNMEYMYMYANLDARNIH
jgi:hypothetical protein